MIRWKVKKSTLQHHYHALSLQFFPHIYSPSLFVIVVEMRPRKDCVMIWSGCVGGEERRWLHCKAKLTLCNMCRKEEEKYIRQKTNSLLVSGSTAAAERHIGRCRLSLHFMENCCIPHIHDGKYMKVVVTVSGSVDRIIVNFPRRNFMLVIYDWSLLAVFWLGLARNDDDEMWLGGCSLESTWKSFPQVEREKFPSEIILNFLLVLTTVENLWKSSKKEQK